MYPLSFSTFHHLLQAPLHTRLSSCSSAGRRGESRSFGQTDTTPTLPVPFSGSGWPLLFFLSRRLWSPLRVCFFFLVSLTLIAYYSLCRVIYQLCLWYLQVCSGHLAFAVCCTSLFFLFFLALFAHTVSLAHWSLLVFVLSNEAVLRSRTQQAREQANSWAPKLEKRIIYSRGNEWLIVLPSSLLSCNRFSHRKTFSHPSFVGCQFSRLFQCKCGLLPPLDWLCVGGV